MNATPVLDACCGSRAFWFQHDDTRALFIDNRSATYRIDSGTPGTTGRSDIVIDPDLVADFTAMPFLSESFHLVVFDPPPCSTHRTEGSGHSALRRSYRRLARHAAPRIRGVFPRAQAERNARVQVGRVAVQGPRGRGAISGRSAVRPPDEQDNALVRVHQAGGGLR
jgi:hypothetical protein